MSKIKLTGELWTEEEKAERYEPLTEAQVRESDPCLIPTIDPYGSLEAYIASFSKGGEYAFIPIQGFMSGFATAYIVNLSDPNDEWGGVWVEDGDA